MGVLLSFVPAQLVLQVKTLYRNTSTELVEGCFKINLDISQLPQFKMLLMLVELLLTVVLKVGLS